MGENKRPKHSYYLWERTRDQNINITYERGQETKTLILLMRERTRDQNINITYEREDKRPKHYITYERQQETKILILPMRENKRPKY